MSRNAWMVGLAILAASCSSSVNMQQEAIGLMERDRAWSQSVKNLDSYLSFFAPTATVYPPGSIQITGPDAIRKMASEMFGSPGFSITWTPTAASVSSSGDLGYTTGTYTANMNGATERGKYVTIWKKTGGEWKADEDIFNTNDSAPEPGSR